MLREKEYFNIIVLNKYDLQILSTTYVFNDSNIIEYPILEKDYSKKKAKSQVILEENKISKQNLTDCPNNMSERNL